MAYEQKLFLGYLPTIYCVIRLCTEYLRYSGKCRCIYIYIYVRIWRGLKSHGTSTISSVSFLGFTCEIKGVPIFNSISAHLLTKAQNCTIKYSPEINIFLSVEFFKTTHINPIGKNEILWRDIYHTSLITLNHNYVWICFTC